MDDAGEAPPFDVDESAPVKRLRVLVACEYSGTVRDCFLARGHDAWSCDLVPHEVGGPHIQDDVLKHLSDGWDLMIAHPPCERLCASGAVWKYVKEGWADEQDAALKFVAALLDAPIPKIALENPVGIISSRIRKPEQVIQPWMFGINETKATCLWLKNLKPLLRTHIDNDLFCPPAPVERLEKNRMVSPGPNRKKLRSWRYKPIAEAMAAQWG